MELPGPALRVPVLTRQQVISNLRGQHCPLRLAFSSLEAESRQVTTDIDRVSCPDILPGEEADKIDVEVVAVGCVGDLPGSSRINRATEEIIELQPIPNFGVLAHL